MSKKVLFEEMFPDEFKDALAANPLAYLPLGALEFHGWHNALGLDAIKAQRICEEAAKQTGGIVLPALFLGVDLYPELDQTKHPNKQYDCYHVDKAEYQKLLEGYIARIFKIGFKKLFIFAGHYPNAAVAQQAADKFKAGTEKIWVAKEPDLVNGESGDHAGKWETSLLMVLCPDLVDLSRSRGDNRLMAVDGEDPIQSSTEYGNEILEKIIKGISQQVR